MTHHDLKTEGVFFDAVKRGEKTFEVRRNDRFFQLGDTVRLLKYQGACYVMLDGSLMRTLPPGYDDRVDSLTFRVGPILQGGHFGIEPGFCVFSLLPIEVAA